MSEIDVASEILSDPDIAGTAFDVLRREQVMTQFGRYDAVVTRIPGVIGSVVPTGDNSLVREEAYQTQSKTIRVVTKFRLRGEAKDTLDRSYQPDIVEWPRGSGEHYLVKTIGDFSGYGPGFVEAECSSMIFVDAPPPASAPAVGRADFSDSANSGLTGAR